MIHAAMRASWRALAAGCMLAWLAGVNVALATDAGTVPADAAQDTPPAPPSKRFDCEDAFDLVAKMVVFRCANYVAPATANGRIETALTRLRDAGLMSGAEAAGAQIAFCPLAQGTGMVPVPGRMYLDDGLIDLSADGLAEIIAHEFVHIHQFEQLGERGFKCAYVRAMVDCGGCQDRKNALEADAYARQDMAREKLKELPAGAKAL